MYYVIMIIVIIIYERGVCGRNRELRWSGLRRNRRVSVYLHDVRITSVCEFRPFDYFALHDARVTCAFICVVFLL